MAVMSWWKATGSRSFRGYFAFEIARVNALHLDQGTSLPVATWHAQIGSPIIADSILDWLVHNVHRIEMQGESMRKRRGGKNGMEARVGSARKVSPVR